MGLNMRGHSGEVRLGYRVAAKLTNWTLDENGRVEAVPTERVDMLLDQAPLSLRLNVGQNGRVWAWQQVEMLDYESPLVIRVIGSPEVR